MSKGCCPTTSSMSETSEGHVEGLLPYYVPHDPIAHAKVAKVGKGIEEVQKWECENVRRWFQSWKLR